MYRIGEILEQALLLHDCVILPTVGAFIVEHTPPLYDRRLNTITPAGQRISFNAALVERDGILDSFYAQTLGLSVRRARLIVDSDITAIRHHLYQSGVLMLGSSLGTITLQESGEILFSPAKERQGLRSIRSYGLYPQSCLIPSVSVTRNAPMETQSRDSGSKKYWTIRLNQTATNWAAAIAICLLCLLPVSSDSHTDRYSAGFVPYGWLNELDKEAPRYPSGEPTNTKSSEAESVSTLSTQADLHTITNLVISPDEAMQEGSHVVVVGVFEKELRARRFIDETAPSKMTTTDDLFLRIIQEPSRYLVIAGICPSAEKANELRRYISTLEDNYTDAWVYAL